MALDRAGATDEGSVELDSLYILCLSPFDPVKSHSLKFIHTFCYKILISLGVYQKY